MLSSLLSVETGKTVSLNFSILFSVSLSWSISTFFWDVSQKIDMLIISISTILLSYSSSEISPIKVVIFSKSW